MSHLYPSGTAPQIFHAVQVVSGNSSSTKVSKSGFDAREVDASEYEPQIVELPSEAESGSGSGEEGGSGRSGRGNEEEGGRGSGEESGRGKVRSDDASSDGASESYDSESSSSSDEDNRHTDKPTVRDQQDTQRTTTTTNGKSGSNGDSTADRELSVKEREALWVKRLNEMRERYLASMTEKEKEDFFKRLEV